MHGSSRTAVSSAPGLGLVPRQHSSGQRTVLLGISKRGDRYLRTLLIHGARAAARVAERKRDARSVWLSRLKLRGGPNVAAVALANKNARVLWALLERNDSYRPPALRSAQAASGARLKPDRAGVAARSAGKGAPSPGSVTAPGTAARCATHPRRCRAGFRGQVRSRHGGGKSANREEHLPA